MGIFKCLHRLWRLFPWLFIAGSLALVIGIIFLKTSPLKEKNFTFFKNKEAVLFFHSSKALTPLLSFPIESMQAFDDLTFTDIVIKGTKWKIAALRVVSVGDLMAELSMKGGEKCLFPMIIVAQDSAGSEYLIIGNEEKQISLNSMHYLLEHSNKKWVKVAIFQGEHDEEILSLCIEMRRIK